MGHPRQLRPSCDFLQSKQQYTFFLILTRLRRAEKQDFSDKRHAMEQERNHKSESSVFGTRGATASKNFDQATLEFLMGHRY